MHTSSIYAKILGETNFHTREIPRSGSKAKDGEREKKTMVITKAKLRMAHASTHGARKPHGPIEMTMVETTVQPSDNEKLRIY